MFEHFTGGILQESIGTSTEKNLYLMKNSYMIKAGN